jgi:transposase
MALLWVDTAYQGLFAWLRQQFGWDLWVIAHLRWRPASEEEGGVSVSGFQPLPRRWVVERTFAWLGRNRRLSKDYEQLPEVTEAWMYLGMIRLLLRRLARAQGDD